MTTLRASLLLPILLVGFAGCTSDAPADGHPFVLTTFDGLREEAVSYVNLQGEEIHVDVKGISALTSAGSLSPAIALNIRFGARTEQVLVDGSLRQVRIIQDCIHECEYSSISWDLGRGLAPFGYGLVKMQSGIPVVLERTETYVLHRSTNDGKEIIAIQTELPNHPEILKGTFTFTDGNLLPDTIAFEDGGRLTSRTHTIGRNLITPPVWPKEAVVRGPGVGLVPQAEENTFDQADSMQATFDALFSIEPSAQDALTTGCLQHFAYTLVPAREQLDLTTRNVIFQTTIQSIQSQVWSYTRAEHVVTGNSYSSQGSSGGDEAVDCALLAQSPAPGYGVNRFVDLERILGKPGERLTFHYERGPVGYRDASEGWDVLRMTYMPSQQTGSFVPYEILVHANSGTLLRAVLPPQGLPH